MTEPNESSSLANSNRILVAEDDDAMRDLLVGWLHEAGYDVTTCSCGLDLLGHLEKSVLSGELPEFDLVLSDIRMPLGNALDVMGEFFGCDGVPPVILITAFGDRRTHAAASRLGAATVLEKPFERCRLMAEIERLRVFGIPARRISGVGWAHAEASLGSRRAMPAQPDLPAQPEIVAAVRE